MSGGPRPSPNFDREAFLLDYVPREELQRALDDATRLRFALLKVERTCPCGARPESLNTHPHVTGCPVGCALYPDDSPDDSVRPHATYDEPSEPDPPTFRQTCDCILVNLSRCPNHP